MGIKAIAKLAPVHIPYTISAGEAADCQIFVADQDYEVMDVRETHSIAGASSSTVSVQIASSGTAPGSSVNTQETAFALDSTVNTPVQATLSSTLSARKMDKGEQISLNFSGTVSAYEGAIHIVLKPIRTNTTY